MSRSFAVIACLFWIIGQRLGAKKSRSRWPICRRGQSGRLSVGITGFQQARRTDLLEKDLGELEIADGRVVLDLPGRGFAGLHLLP